MDDAASSTADAATATAALALLVAGEHDAQALGALLRTLPHTATPDAVLQSAGRVRAAVNASFTQAQALIQRGVDRGIAAIPLCSPRYPQALRRLRDAPPILYLRGHAAVLAHTRTVAVVGTRHASANGQVIAQRLAAYLSAQGWSVVSGLSAGIDSAAQTGALQGDQPPIAVLPHGLDRQPPRAQRALAEQILQQRGAWVSEHPCGTRPSDAQLRQAGRIQVGLTRGTVIVEGDAHSSVQAQADFCRREGRVLLTVLPEDTPTRSQLPRALAEHGAQVIRSRQDYPALLAALDQAALGTPAAQASPAD